VYNALLSAYTRGELINAAAEKLFEEIPVNIMWFFGPRWFRATPRMGSTRKRMWEKKGVLPNELTVRRKVVFLELLELGEEGGAVRKGEGPSEELYVTPDFRRGTKCISYVRQDQFTHI
jgi:hypothetical protein